MVFGGSHSNCPKPVCVPWMDGWVSGWLDVKESAEEAQRGSESQRTVIKEASVLEKMMVAVVISVIICCN